MANTYVLITSNVLTGTAATVTFSAIPATYTDLMVKMSVRSDQAVTNDMVRVRLNGSSLTNYSGTRITALGSGTPASGRNLNGSAFTQNISMNGTSSTSNTFGNIEFYLPSYTNSNNKIMTGFGAAEDNASAAGLADSGNYYRNTTSISSISFLTNAGNFVSGSSFYLYGIKNS